QGADFVTLEFSKRTRFVATSGPGALSAPGSRQTNLASSLASHKEKTTAMLSTPRLPLIRLSMALGAILALQAACGSTGTSDLGGAGGVASGTGGAAPSGGA